MRRNLLACERLLTLLCAVAAVALIGTTEPGQALEVGAICLLGIALGALLGGRV